MVNYKHLLKTNWLHYEPVQQWYQSRRSNSWDKPIQNQMQKVFEKGYLRRESAANTLPRSSQRKLLSRESKEMLRRKVKEIKAYNASNVRAAIKEKENGKATTRKEKKARCYVCRKRGHIFWKCPNKKNRTIVEVPAKDNNSKKPTVMRTEEKLKYPKRVHVITDYMIEGTYYSNWDNIWFRMEGTEESEKKFIFSYGIGEATVETKDRKMPWFREEPVKTKMVEGGHDYAKKENPQGCDGLEVGIGNTCQGNKTRFGVNLEGNKTTTVNNEADQEDSSSTSGSNDFVVIT
nr:ARID DNA-binding domain-containing protein [Tanacetum cinerariifolium]